MLCDMFTKVFVNRDYRSARSNVLFDLERAMFPDTMPYVERELLKKKNAAQIHTNNRQINALGEHRYVFNLIGTSPELMRDQLPALLDIHRLELENQILTREMEVPVKRDQAREFLQPCSRNGCNGFLSTAWKCRACDGYTCKECHEPKNDPHTCNPDTVKSVAQIKTDSKQCPKCSSLIFKTEGCDQMYCTNCHTAFSWKTGKIELGRIHNPHYYEYQRQRGRLNREIGDVQCGGMPDMYSFPRTDTNVLKFHRQILEFQQYHLPQYMPGEVNAFDLNLRHRIAFLLKFSSEDCFKDEIFRKDKDLAKRREIGMVGTTFVQIMSDIFNRYIHTKSFDEFSRELQGSIGYCNELFADISRTYGCVVPVIEYPMIVFKKK